MPGFAADNQDAILLFWDASANEVSRQLYDDSANSWAETSIAGSMTELGIATAGPNMSAFPDLSNNRVVMCAWENTDTATAKLRCWTVTESAITEKTNIVASSGDDQGLCVIGLDTTTGYWHAFYCGKSDGSETWNTATRIYHKVSTDAGATWGAEELVSGTAAFPFWGLMTLPRFATPWQIGYQLTASNELNFLNNTFSARGAP
jgi:Neuraminidase (sialidase)